MGLIRMYLESMILYMIVALPIYIIMRGLFVKIKQKKVKLLREIILASFMLYLVGLASQTIIPKWDMGVWSDTGKFYFEVYRFNEFVNVNWIPFQTVAYFFMAENELVSNWGSIALINLVGNIVLFSPIGFLVPYLWSGWRSIRKILLLGLAVTIFIESIQFFIGRSPDIDDVILNTLGVLMGYWLFTFLCRLNKSRKKG